jgi:hypothetical protein
VLTMLRREVQDMMAAVGKGMARKPALRRASNELALLATDFPLIADEECTRRFRRLAQENGWRVWLENGWLMLDKAVPAPAMAAPSDHADNELRCCISLLTRHPEAGDATRFIRALVKADEAGRQPMQRLCRQMHQEFAAMLRMHQPLPGALLPYLCRAAGKGEDAI